jgi:uncharacterized membrane protein
MAEDTTFSPRNAAVKIFLDIGLIVSLSFITGWLVFFVPASPLRALLGIAFFFFFPGYSCQIALTPQDKSASTGLTILLSFGLSLLIAGLLYLIVSYTIGLDLLTGFYAIFFWNLLMSFAALYRRISWALKSSRQNQAVQQGGQRRGISSLLNSKLLYVILLLVIAIAGGHLVKSSAVAVPQYVEFYLLGQSGLAGDYPTQEDQPVSVTLGIINHGNQNPYEIYYQYDAGGYIYLDSVTLADEEQWESLVDLQPPAGTEKITFALMNQDGDTPLRTVHLWLTEE